MVEKRDTRAVPHDARRDGEAGFSLIEVMIVIMLIAIVGGMAVPVASNFLQSKRADSSVVATESAIVAARDRAVAERRNIQMDFIGTDKIRLSRVEVPGGGLTQLSEFSLDNGQKFIRFGGMPDTPDNFGGALPQSFSGTPPVMFTSDGSLIDSAGDIVNGTVYVGMTSQQDTARAVTIFGVTGLTRAWKWRGMKWME